MPIIELGDPLAAGVNAANSWAEGQQNAKAKALELARQKQLDDRAQANADRTFTESKDEFAQSNARANKVADHDIARDDAATAIAKDNQKHADELFPFVKKKAQLDIQAQTDDHQKAAAALAGAKLDNEIKKIEVKFGPQAAQDAHNTAVAQYQHENASTQHEYAATAHENAETGLTRQYTRNLSEGLTKTGGTRGGKLDYTALQSSLSPAGQKAWQQIQGMATGNNPPNVAQLLALINSPQVKLSAADKQIMSRMMGTAEGRFAAAPVTEAQQNSARKPLMSMRSAIGDLPKTIQDPILQMFKGGRGDSISAIQSTIDKSPNLTDDEKKQVRAALSQVDPSLTETSQAQPRGGGFDLGGILKGAATLLGPGAAALGAGANAGNADPSAWAK